jgi:hypothetical protein
VTINFPGNCHAISRVWKAYLCCGAPKIFLIKVLAIFPVIYRIWKTNKNEGWHDCMQASNSLSSAFSGAATRLYAVNWHAAAKDAGQFFLACLQQMPPADDRVQE